MNVYRILLMTLILSISAFAQDPSAEPPKKFKCFTQYGHLPKGFSDLMEICLILPEGGDASQVIGQVGTTRYVRGTSKFLVHKFDRARLILQDATHAVLSFNTEAKEGIRYRFNGKLIGESERTQAASYKQLRGKLTKIRKGHRVAEWVLRFSPAIQE